MLISMLLETLLYIYASFMYVGTASIMDLLIIWTINYFPADQQFGPADENPEVRPTAETAKVTSRI